MLRFIAVAFFLMLLTGNAFADTPVASVGVQCGMEESPDGTLKVKAADPSICEDDVAFAALYMMFSDIFNDSAVKPFALWFVDEAVMNSEFIQFVMRRYLFQTTYTAYLPQRRGFMVCNGVPFC